MLKEGSKVAIQVGHMLLEGTILDLWQDGRGIWRYEVQAVDGNKYIVHTADIKVAE